MLSSAFCEACAPLWGWTRAWGDSSVCPQLSRCICMWKDCSVFSATCSEVKADIVACNMLLACFKTHPFDPLQQLLRERQQMASRPFASVDVALEVGAEQTDFLRGPLEVGAVVLRGQGGLHIDAASLICICLQSHTESDYLELTRFGHMCYGIFKTRSFNGMTWALAKATGESISPGKSDRLLTGSLRLTDRSWRNLRCSCRGRSWVPCHI